MNDRVQRGAELSADRESPNASEAGGVPASRPPVVVCCDGWGDRGGPWWCLGRAPRGTVGLF